MKKISIPFLLTLMFVAFNTGNLFAQFPGMPGGGGKGGGSGTGGFGGLPQGMKMNIGRIFGKVLDPKTKKGIEFASVALYTLKGDSLTAGQLTETNGDFSLNDLPFGGYKLKITFLGYKTLEQKVIVSPGNGEQELGNINLEVDEKVLKEVTVTADKPMLELKPDRKVFNVDKDLSAKGGTGVDVMKNIPGVSTDADGNVTLRNNSPILYIDGKPTTLTLAQIPADQIDKVEVITNPSAKFQADASGGIINVVMKKNQKPGYNGMATMALATNTGYNGMALINVHERKFGFTLMYNINGSTNRTYSYTDRSLLLTDGSVWQNLHEDDQTTSKRLFQVGRVGLDLYVNNRTTVSLSETMVFGSFKTTDALSSRTDTLGRLEQTQSRTNSQNAAFRNFTTDLNIHHTYPTADKEWTLDFNYNHARGFTDYLYSTKNYNAAGMPLPYLLPFNPWMELDSGGSRTEMLTMQYDFTTPLPKNLKLDVGARSFLQRQYTANNVVDMDGVFTVANPFVSNAYRLDNMVNAAYVTFGGTAAKQFTFQVGLRFEETYFMGHLGDSSIGYKYPSSISKIYECLFPSLNLSEKFNDKHELQFNITRKTNRPNFFQISPFIFAAGNNSYRIGNPTLQPEFNNKAELNYDLTLTKFTWLSSLYGTYSEHPIIQYSNSDLRDSTFFLINTFANGKNSLTGGWENTMKLSVVKGLDITATGNVFYTSISSNVGGVELKKSGVSWNVKGIISYKIPVIGVVAQVNGTYEAPRIQPQGHTLPMYFFDFSLNKDFGIASLNFTISDVMNSRVHGTYTETPEFIQTSTRRRDQRYARLGVTIKFGKLDSSIFKLKKQMKKEMQNGGGEDMGF